MVVSLRSKAVFARKVSMKDKGHVCNILSAHFLEIHLLITLKVANRPIKKLLLATNFLNLICNYLSQKSRLFGKISPILENTYLKS